MMTCLPVQPSVVNLKVSLGSVQKDDVVEPSYGSGERHHGYIRTRLAPLSARYVEPYDCFEKSNFERFGSSESLDSGSFQGGPDLLRSGLGGSFGSGYDSSFPSSRFDDVESGWDSSYPSATVRSGFLENGGRDHFSSCASDFSPPILRPAPVGSRGRGMPVYLQNKFGGTDSDLGGPSVLRGQGRRTLMFGKSRPVYAQANQMPAQPLGCMKRKMMAPIQPTMFLKRLKPFSVKETGDITSSAEGGAHVDCGNMEHTDESVEERQRRARREKQKRKREKDIEKYGDKHRLAFTCAFCKVRTCEVEEIEEHFGSRFRWETLDHIEKQTKFDKKVIAFLHAIGWQVPQWSDMLPLHLEVVDFTPAIVPLSKESMVNKFRKTVLRKRNAMGPETSAENVQQDLTKVVKQEVCLSKVEMIQCTACHVHIPASLVSVQQHLRSAEHQKSQQEFSETQKRESVLTATSIMTNPIVKVRYEKYLKGENPFKEELKEEPAKCDQEELPDGSVAS